MVQLNYDKILADKEMPSFIKDLVRALQFKGLVHIGHWIKNLSTVDLLSISNSCKQVRKGPPPLDPKDDLVGDLPVQVAGSYIFLVDILAAAEGLDIVHEMGTFKTRATLLESFVSVETLKRRKFDINVFYENMSLSEDLNEEEKGKPVFEVGPEFKEQLAKSLMRELVNAMDKVPNLEDREEVEKEIDEMGGQMEREIEKLKGGLGLKPQTSTTQTSKKPSLIQQGKDWLKEFRSSKGSGEREV